MTEYRHEIGSEESSRIRRFLYVVAGGTVAVALVLLVAFLTAERWLLFISHNSERRFVDRYVALAKDHLLKPSDPVLQRYVEDLTQQLAAHMRPPEDLSIRVHVVKGPPNAVATLGGHIFVLEGLLHTLNSENSLAMVLAHELAHCVNRDPLRSAGRGVGRPPELLSTHPAIDERIEAIRSSARENGWRALPTRPYPDDVKAALGWVEPSARP